MNAPHLGVLRVQPGASFAAEHPRVRPHGRIGGMHGVERPGGVEELVRALGPGAMLLDSPRGLVADWDCCWIDGHCVNDIAAWQAILRAGRIAEVRGAFALAWRAGQGDLYLCRDAIGERTIYWAQIDNGIVFASTMRALLASGCIARDLDPLSVAAYLAFAYLPGARTMLRGVRELLPGEVLHWDGSRVQSSRLWSLGPEPDYAASVDEDGEAVKLRALLEDAVRRRLPESAGEPIGATLSGGVDSSLVVALVRKLHAAPLHTYSISFGAEYRNELAFSRLVAAHCGSVHHVLELPQEAILDHLDDTIALLSNPIGDPLTVPNALAFREAARDVSVVLNGEGGDPCFGGPKNLPMLLAELLGDGREGGPISAHGAEAVGEFGRERSYLRAHEKCFDDLPAMLTREARAPLVDAPLERFLAEHFADPRWQSFVTRLQAMNLTFKGAHHILHKVDEVSFPFGVQARSPLFDRDVVEAAFAMAPTMRLRGSVEKYLLKRAVADLLPRSIIERPKSGMLVPVEAWFRGPLHAHARERLLDGLTRWNLFERDYLERLLAGKLPGVRPRHGAKIWLLVTLEAWLRMVVGREPAS
jgi:asparagine synthase (glutamine-hydrolysing)